MRFPRPSKELMAAIGLALVGAVLVLAVYFMLFPNERAYEFLGWIFMLWVGCIVAALAFVLLRIAFRLLRCTWTWITSWGRRLVGRPGSTARPPRESILPDADDWGVMILKLVWLVPMVAGAGTTIFLGYVVPYIIIESLFA